MTRGDGYLHNRRTAWAMPRRIGGMYLTGAYLTPLGWETMPEIDAAWWTDADGYITRKALQVPLAEAKVVDARVIVK